MDENQALLGKGHTRIHYQPNKNKTRANESIYEQQTHFSNELNDGASSSEGSDNWEDSHSSWSSSCSGSTSNVSVEWENDINPMNELFFIKSEPPDSETLLNISSLLAETNSNSEKPPDSKQGKLSRWIRRRNSKRTRTGTGSKLSVLSSAKSKSKVTFRDDEDLELHDVILFVDPSNLNTFGRRLSYVEGLLGLVVSTQTEQQRIIVVGFTNDGPASANKHIKIGDILRSINNEIVTVENIDTILSQITSPCELRLKFGRVDRAEGSTQDKNYNKLINGQSELVRTILTETSPQHINSELYGVVVINLQLLSSETNQSEVCYTYPDKCTLFKSRGSFITLNQLLPEFVSGKPVSSSMLVNNQLVHVCYVSHDNMLMLVALPDSKFTLCEVVQITQDITKCLLFQFQSLARCFAVDNYNNTGYLNQFFSQLFVSEFLTDNFSQFQLPHWLPLPKEVQLQMDDAMNELEANDFGEMHEDIRSKRKFTILGSCLYHRGYLLSSHLTKEDLLDVHSYVKLNNLLHLTASEKLRSLVVWKKVYPMSCNRGLPPTASSAAGQYPLPAGSWYLLLTGRRHDLLATLLERDVSVGAVRPDVTYVEEVEDTLHHIQRLGVTELAGRLVSRCVRPECVTPDHVTGNRTCRKKDVDSGGRVFNKCAESAQKTSGGAGAIKQSSELISILKRRGSGQQQTRCEDSVSQGTSNVSEVSDENENVPILGRRAGNSGTVHSDESDSDCCWNNYKESHLHDSMSSCFDYCDSGKTTFSDMESLIPSRLTSGVDNVLFHYVHVDTGDGVIMSPPTIHHHTTSLLNKFKHSAQTIHELLQNSVKFKQLGHDSVISKSLVAIKEHGVLLELHLPNDVKNNTGPSTTLFYWVIGRLFFTPHPREVYVCYLDECPQNLVEIAFRLALNSTG